MKDHHHRRKQQHQHHDHDSEKTTTTSRPLLSWMFFFWLTLLFVFSSALLTSFTALRSFYPDHLRSVALVVSPILHVKRPIYSPPITVRDTILLPYDAIIFLDYPSSLRPHAAEDIQCTYSSPNNSSLSHAPPLKIERPHPLQLMVRCLHHPLGLNHMSVFLSLQSKPYVRPNHKWDPLVYHALFDHDNSTLVFVKGFNLRQARQTNSTRFQCLYEWDFNSKEYVISSGVISAAQEIIRCKTPPGILEAHHDLRHSLRVSVRMIGNNKTIPTIAMPGLQPQLPKPPFRKTHNMCVCTMVRNQARFMKEWIMYHTKIGVEQWFIYDNNSDDDILDVIGDLQSTGHNITRNIWPWIKTQEAGFAHCALQARDVCDFVGFIDVDEFFHLKKGQKTLQEAIMDETRDLGIENVGEIRTECYNFGPSRLTKIPREGVMAGYTCKVARRERHKSIVRPEALHQDLLNVVHHFHLRDGYKWMDANGTSMAINHYKYQVWDVFKGKFEGRVSAYVVDWKSDENARSKDRVPGLGSIPVEPPDWPRRYCEVWDSGLKDRVVRDFMDPETRLLPWQPKDDMVMTLKSKRRRQRGG